jgi:U3 small nucleolar RNA-associated protein 18
MPPPPSVKPAFANSNAAEAALADSLFGGLVTSSAPAGAAWADSDDEEGEEEDAAHLQLRNDIDHDAAAASDSESEDAVPATTDAWHDEDDEALQVSLTSTNRTKKLRKTMDEDVISGAEYQARLQSYKKTKVSSTASWAKLPSSDPSLQPASENPDSDDDDDEAATSTATSTKPATTTLASLLSSTAPLLAASSLLPRNNIISVRCKDVNQTDPSSSSCNTHFHPSGLLALTAGMDKTLRFFSVDGEENKKIHGIHFPDLPIMQARFVREGESVLLSGRRPFLYTYDVTSGVVEKLPKILGRNEKSWEKFASSNDGSMVAFVGKDGYVVLLTTKTFNWLGQVKMNGTCRCVTFSPCSRYIIASGSDGDVYKWDVRQLGGGAVSRFKNQDGTITSAVAVSDHFTAVGAESGVVNVYRKNDGWNGDFSTPRQPMKAIMNITTACDMLQFNHDGQILAMASRRNRDTLKLVHMPSATVFANWPTSKTPLGHVWSFDFSPKSGYMAIGNEKGKCLLYRLNHYKEI